MSHLKEKVLKPFSWVLRLIMVQLKKCDCSVRADFLCFTSKTVEHSRYLLRNEENSTEKNGK